MALNIGVTPVIPDGTDVEPIPTNVEDETAYFVEVIRQHGETREVFHGSSVVDVAVPVGTLLNVGAGPELPENPYEGQVWILT